MDHLMKNFPNLQNISIPTYEGRSIRIHLLYRWNAFTIFLPQYMCNQQIYVDHESLTNIIYSLNMNMVNDSDRQIRPEACQSGSKFPF